MNVRIGWSLIPSLNQQRAQSNGFYHSGGIYARQTPAFGWRGILWEINEQKKLCTDTHQTGHYTIPIQLSE